MRILAELLRILIIFVLLGALGWGILVDIYTVKGVGSSYRWIGALAVVLLLFVLYRNKLQFSGWYKGKGRKKLSKNVTTTLISTSVVLIILPFIVHSFVD